MKPNDSRNSGGAPPHAPRHWRRVGSLTSSLVPRGFMRRRKKLQKQGGLDRLLLLSLPAPTVRTVVTCNNIKRTTQSTLIFLFLFCRSASLFADQFLFLCFLILLYFRWQRSCGWDPVDRCVAAGGL